MPDSDLELITLRLAFERGQPEPSRVFLAMRDMIEALQGADKALARGFTVELSQELLLEDIQEGSLRVILAQRVSQVLEQVPDEVLAAGDWKRVVGTFLVKGKHKLASYIESRTGVGSPAEIVELGRDLQTLATETGMGLIPAYEPPSSRELLGVLQMISHATQELREGDTVSLESDQGAVAFNPGFVVTDADVTRVMTRNIITNEGMEQVLKVRKPDFLGGSQWEFRWAYGKLAARIDDPIWTEQFHRQVVVIRPGDSLRVRMDSVTHFGHDGAPLETHHTIRQVLEVIPGTWTEDPPVLGED